MPSRVFPSRHVQIFVVVWDCICALSALFGVASDVHLVPTTHEFEGPLVASFSDRLAFIYGIWAFVCVRCPCAIGGRPCPPEFSLRDIQIFVVVWDSFCALSAPFGVGSDVHFVPTTYEFHTPLVVSF